ncbi:ATP-binding protein [Catenovulum sp. SM1970]|uniref:ATP-binding protein n=1 Tax=Marinifaba aquimaris TaxID=2741323 RepID=UPI001571A44E|nr:ATP-binding protein [Marinifaba aquimaris]NTS77532.1 ATP-binding protein [Marinifaba aquimaris]
MFKAFFKLWIVVFVPLFIMIFPNPYSPLDRLNEYAKKSWAIKTYQSTFYLLNKSLRSIPESQWQKEIDILSKDFGYELLLLPIKQGDTEDDLSRALLSDEFVYQNTDPGQLLRRIPNSQWAISLSLNPNENERISRSASGGIALLKKELENQPTEQWLRVTNDLASRFDYDIDILSVDDISLESDKLSQLHQQELTWQYDQDYNLIFYQMLSNGHSVVRISSINENMLTAKIFTVIILAFVTAISIAMFLWVYPLWRDINKLTKTAALFGEGYLDKRSVMAKTSVLARLSDSFNQMAERIEKLIVEHRELTNAIAHDLRTPLYRLRFAFEMLREEGVSQQDKYKYQSAIDNSIEDLDHLINQTLILSRYSRATDVTLFTQCYLAQTILKEVAYFRDQHDDLNIELVIAKDLEHRQLFVDEKALNRALTNLLSNALRYANHNLKVSLLLSVNEGVEVCSLIVEDDGKGVSDEDKHRILKPFTQLDSKEREANSGHGLGLAIVNQIANWHNGSITVEDSELGGAKFALTWPI